MLRTILMSSAGLMFSAVCLFGGAARAETVAFNATLNGASEVPAKTTDGKGTASASLDTATKVMTYGVQYTGLSGPATAAHFHGPAEVGTNAGVMIPIASFKSPFTGTAGLSDAQAADLAMGRLYINLHTSKFPNGEIRGQVLKNK